MPRQHVHTLTPYPHSVEGSAFPFPTVPAKQPTPSSSSSSSSSSYAAFRYPRPHAASHPSASFPLRLSTIHSPIPPSLLERRRSSCSTVHSIASSSSSSTSSWGNWSADSPPALSRSGSTSSRNGAIDLQTPETIVFPDFEEENHPKSSSMSAYHHTDANVDDYAHEAEVHPVAPVSAMKRGGIARPRLFVKLAEPDSSVPRLQRKQTPLVPFTLGSTGLFGPAPAISNDANIAATTTTLPTSSSMTTPVSRPKLERKLTPHPATEPASHLPSSPDFRSTKHYVPDLSTLVLGEADEEDEDDDDEREDRPRGRSTFRAFQLERTGQGRRFSSVIQEGKVWLAV